MFGLLRTTGESSLRTHFPSGEGENTDKILEGLSTGGGDIAIAGDVAPRKQTDDTLRRKGNQSIEVETVEKGASVDAGIGPKTVAPRTDTQLQPIDTALGECSDGINSVVRRYLPQVKQCHETRLKSDPTVAGRLVVDVDIENGTVISVKSSQNTTKDVALSKCVERKIKRWKFPSECSDLASFPFVLSPKK